ncbi:conserved hypothetical protein [Flavobacterium sp. 9AF]|uniref:hypothetical protein n=1 Tax=Flavobacterium sp. 9AF TaxID=2653142 RepID=UPI0012F1B05B|nr:hypothetical protein [Flavobacterium sp. 9AF]VXB61819.1 conserved hypothetical protein [Flavobacterium sp. 9AF]
MERRNFVKKMSAFTTGSLLLSGSNLYSFETEKKINNKINLSSSFSNREIILKGNFVDAITLEPINKVSMKIKPLKSRLSYDQYLETEDSFYEIKTGFSSINNKVIEKIEIEITAEGYKPLISEIYLSKFGCNIHCSIWKYNPNLKIEDSPKNDFRENYTLSKFNFHLIK